MIKYTFLLIAGVFLAQMLVAGLAVWWEQNKNPNINYWKAMQMYLRKNFGRYIVVAVSTLILCFIMSEYMNLSLTREDLLKKGVSELTRTEKIQLNFKTWSIVVGTFIELLATIFYRAGFKAIADFGRSKGADTDDIKNT